ncbi:MAG: UDP-N-acetylglucosamine 1-carboxyvinyltransferase [Gemmatimonadetes bacterium]|nr:UDP-N-acetylglucosamine 1-carboxyvinyltransferase [Gemmatimonadota bacterium]
MASLQFIVEGGRPLSGSIRPSGNKNAALPIVAAALMTDQPVTLDNVPRIRDIETLVELVRTTGASAEWEGRNTLHIHAARLKSGTLDPAMCARIRASILLAAPMLVRCGSVELTPPGGDVIGRRRLDTHFLALEALGAAHDLTDRIRFTTRGLVGADVFLDEPSVTGTENAVMAAVGAKGTTVIRNAACEPHVQDLCHFLVALGGRIQGIGTNMLTIHGGTALRGTRHRIGADHIEVGSFIGLAAVTKSALRIEDAGVEHLRAVRMGFDRLGVRTEIDGAALVVPANQSMTIQTDLGGHVPKLEDQPWPAFPADVMSIAIVTATQCSGIILMHEKMFESRMFFVDKLISMGARIVLCDPHRALVAGPSPLRGATVESPDIRAGMAMLIAALCANGTSTINNIGQIERGYERIHERLNALGAGIKRVEA